VNSIRHTLVANLLLLSAYLVSALFTLSLNLPPIGGSPVWVPTGISLGATLIWGYRLLPAIFLGDFLVAYQLVGFADITSIYVCIMFGVQAMAHAWLATWWLKRKHLWPNPLIDEKAIILFFWIAAGLSLVIVTVLFGFSQWLIDRLPSDQFFFTLFIWWVGSAIGVVIFTPLVLVFFAKPRERWRRRMISLALPLLILFLVLISVLYYTKALEQKISKREFTSHVNQAQSLVERELHKSTILLKLMRSYVQLGQVDLSDIFDGYLQEFIDGGFYPEFTDTSKKRHTMPIRRVHD